MSVLWLVAGLALLLSAAMAAVWTIARRPGKSGWTDAVWSYATGAAAALGALAPLAAPPTGRQWLVAAMAGAWGLRLGTHIAARNRKDADDPRYRALIAQWGAVADARLFRFLQVQALCGLVLALAVSAAARNPATTGSWSDVAGLCLFLFALAGESLADAQLTRFRADPANRGKLADTGLWRWSRHPNYFFEWLGWCAYPLIAIGPAGGWPWGWAALAAPAMMYWLLVHASGIPPLEAAMLRSRGAAYRDYQRRVSGFWPRPPKA